MCDCFWQPMEGDLGDLADAIFAGGRKCPSNSAADLPTAAEWQLPSYQSMAFHSTSAGGPAFTDDFSDPFVSLVEPLPHELITGVELFDGAGFAVTQAKMVMGSSCSVGIGSHGGDGLIVPQKVVMAEEVKRRPCSILPRAAQVSPGIAKPSPSPLQAFKPSPLAESEIVKVCSSVVSPVDRGGGVQISSPQAPGVKRRKNQAKKVVCIPAPAAASNRTSGEAIPSDLWAWRKYGQKPIKGSPYPRGYYKCSSSKGCSARKQVERSRTDPNLLVITYTSEHNHPWPTQRNALAGSARSQPSRSPVVPKDGPKKEMISSARHRRRPPPLVKEEEASEMDAATNNSIENDELDQVFHQGHKLKIPETNHVDEFFADLMELDPDPMSLIFSKAKQQDHGNKEERALDDPLEDMFDWAAGSAF